MLFKLKYKLFTRTVTIIIQLIPTVLTNYSDLSQPNNKIYNQGKEIQKDKTKKNQKQPLSPINNTPKTKTSYSKNPQRMQRTKWAIFTHYGPETRRITTFFKNTDIGIAFKTTNKIESYLKQREQIIYITRVAFNN
jgi:hypothetical protein